MDGAVIEGGKYFGYFGKQLLRFAFEFGTFFLAHQCQHFLEVFAVEEGVEVVVSHIFFHLRPSENGERVFRRPAVYFNMFLITPITLREMALVTWRLIWLPMLSTTL